MQNGPFCFSIRTVLGIPVVPEVCDKSNKVLSNQSSKSHQWIFQTHLLLLSNNESRHKSFYLDESHLI
jgi:hypothetical protein